MNFFSSWSNLIQSCPDTCSVSWKKLCSFIFGGLYWSFFLITLSLGKEIQGYYYYCFGKIVWTEKVMNFGSKNLYKPCSNTAYCDNQTSRSRKKKGNDQRYWKRSWLLNKFSSSVLWEKYGRQSWWCSGFEGLTHYIFHFTCWRHQLVKWRF